jgi:hypothetical protein
VISARFGIHFEQALSYIYYYDWCTIAVITAPYSASCRKERKNKKNPLMSRAHVQQRKILLNIPHVENKKGPNVPCWHMSVNVILVMLENY